MIFIDFHWFSFFLIFIDFHWFSLIFNNFWCFSEIFWFFQTLFSRFSTIKFPPSRSIDNCWFFLALTPYFPRPPATSMEHHCYCLGFIAIATFIAYCYCLLRLLRVIAIAAVWGSSIAYCYCRLLNVIAVAYCCCLLLLPISIAYCYCLGLLLLPIAYLLMFFLFLFPLSIAYCLLPHFQTFKLSL